MNLLVCKTKEQARLAAAALDLGAEWQSCGYFDSLGGPRFDRIVVLVHGIGDQSAASKLVLADWINDLSLHLPQNERVRMI